MPIWDGIELAGFDAPVARVPAGRRNALAEYLHDLLASAQPPLRAGAARPEAPDEAQRLLDACAACRGHCCRNGGDHAFLGATTLGQVWSEAPELSREALVARYLHAVPERSFEGSCIFHAEAGCSLPKPMRSQLCRDYQCGSLRQLSRSITSR